MRCEEALEALSLSRYGEALNSATREHLEHCEGCRLAAARQEGLDRVLSRDVDQPPRAGFDTRFFARLQDEKVRQKAQPSHWRWLWALVPAATATAIAFIHSPVEPPREVPKDDLALAMELELLEELPLLQQLEDVEAYELLSQLDDKELEQLLDETTP